MKQIQVEFVKLYPDVIVPVYTTPGSAGCDIRAYLIPEKHGKEIHINPYQTVIIPTGLKVAIPDGYEMQVRPRSGLSAKTKIRIANSPGTVDLDFRGEVGIIVDNTSPTDPVIISHGYRIAQLVFAPVVHANFLEVKELSTTTRGEDGFGSSGHQ
jgi:dUTP pyrophosphatase